MAFEARSNRSMLELGDPDRVCPFQHQILSAEKLISTWPYSAYSWKIGESIQCLHQSLAMTCPSPLCHGQPIKHCKTFICNWMPIYPQVHNIHRIPKVSTVRCSNLQHQPKIGAQGPSVWCSARRGSSLAAGHIQDNLRIHAPPRVTSPVTHTSGNSVDVRVIKYSEIDLGSQNCNLCPQWFHMETWHNREEPSKTYSKTFRSHHVHIFLRGFDSFDQHFGRRWHSSETWSHVHDSAIWGRGEVLMTLCGVGVHSYPGWSSCSTLCKVPGSIMKLSFGFAFN
jgi:hypothetical protein